MSGDRAPKTSKIQNEKLLFKVNLLFCVSQIDGKIVRKNKQKFEKCMN